MYCLARDPGDRWQVTNLTHLVSFMVSTEEGDYYESTTVVETEKERQKRLKEKKNKLDKETRNRKQKHSTFYTESGANGREEGDYV